ncbi:MAG TPA: hypothetical protein P5121_05910 [Caldilineaceae bacterium]|nr:hypothetical protein [Caldilineaceae bacterium]HRW04607.1 hypothetical protein [Caldilineaceae bacterium]
MNSTSTAGAGYLARQLYQIWRALRDPSIPWAAKWLIPLAALAYWVSPIDLIPFFPVDDIIVVLVALNLFLRTIAQYQTSEPRGQTAGGAWQPGASSADHNKTIETTWRVVEE